MGPNELSLLRVFRENILKKLDLDRVDAIKDDRAALELEISDVLQRVSTEIGQYLSTQLRLELIKLISDEISGYGPLRDLMEDDTISDILVNGPEQIFVERRGLLEKTDTFFLNNQQLTEIARRLVSKVGRRVDDSQPLVDARLPDGSRLNVVIAPITLDGTSISIRKFGKGKKTLGDLINYGSMDEMMANFLVIAASCKVNIIISGGTGSGKTTLLNALSQYIGETERIITLEDAAELRLIKPHVVRMETRMAGAEQQGMIPMRSLVINSLRMRPDRIIVGECRGEEAFEMLQAMNTGHDGSMSTLHANSPRDAIARLESMVMMASASLPLMAIRRNISSAIHLIIQVSRMPDGSRKVMNVSEVMGMEGENIIIQDIFTFETSSQRDQDGKIQGNYKFNGLLKRSVVYRQGVIYGMTDALNELFGSEII
ncbi:CpaF family protein [Budvicia aquatica]|uniref:CpaF family protein n=1 Tax=Budvicia aquatica TaxID=82979 RepID=UPI0020895159|nr:CpaF family protein [Budvicia aquatica]GKX51711.1 tight adherance operon protein [Budvicia aquatica]